MNCKGLAQKSSDCKRFGPILLHEIYGLLQGLSPTNITKYEFKFQMNWTVKYQKPKTKCIAKRPRPKGTRQQKGCRKAKAQTKKTTNSLL
jgi:hypothetical protein